MYSFVNSLYNNSSRKYLPKHTDKDLCMSSSISEIDKISRHYVVIQGEDLMHNSVKMMD